MSHEQVNPSQPHPDDYKPEDFITDEERGIPSQEEERERFDAEEADEQQRVKDFQEQEKENPGGWKVS